MSFKDNLKYELSCKEYSIKEFARKINVNYDTIISYIDSRETQPSAENAVKIARGLNVTVEYLVTGEKNEFVEYEKNKTYFKNLQHLPVEISSNLKDFVALLSKYTGKHQIQYSL